MYEISLQIYCGIEQFSVMDLGSFRNGFGLIDSCRFWESEKSRSMMFKLLIT